jgi:hypothetical protein
MKREKANPSYDTKQGKTCTMQSMAFKRQSTLIAVKE